MQETLENIIFYARSMWRYRWYAMFLTWLVVVLGWVVILITPITYTANAKVYVNTSTILQPMLKGFAVEQDSTAIISLMARQLVSRPNVEQVARTVGLDQSVKKPQELENLLNQLEQGIKIEGSRTGEGSRQRDFYIISYSNRNPKLAKELVGALIDIFVEKTAKESLRDSEVARQFLEEQIKEYKENLLTAESRIREFKHRYSNELPEQTNYFERLQAAQAALNDITLKITEAEFQRNALDRQLAKLAITYADDSEQLELQKKLDELLMKYTENHPNVIAVRHAIAILKEQQKKTYPEARKALIVPNSSTELLKVKLSEVESGIAVLQVRKEEYLRRINKLEKMNDILPKIEIELQYLNRDYEAAKEKYNALLVRRDSAVMTGSIEQSGESVRFKIIDPPRLQDTWPAKARSLLLSTSLVFAAGLAAGLALAFFLSQIKPAIYGRRILEEITGFSVFGAIPQVITKKMRIWRRVNLVAFLVIGLIMLGIHGVAVFTVLDDVKTLMIQELGDK